MSCYSKSSSLSSGASRCYAAVKQVARMNGSLRPPQPAVRMTHHDVWGAGLCPRPMTTNDLRKVGAR